MELALAPDDRDATRAARAAAEVAGVLPRSPVAGVWWQAGLADAIELVPEPPPVPSRYAAPAPRSRRGATRA